jgi:S1-C subfamily serine protease
MNEAEFLMCRFVESMEVKVPDLLEQLNVEMSTTIERVRPSLVEIANGGGGIGAGTIWHSEGLIVTNAHVVGRRNLRVTLADGRSVSARLLAHDAALDLAALKVDAADLAAIELGRSKRLQPGQWVLALGHPWGVRGAVTAGVVIGLGPHPEGIMGQRNLIQVNLPLRPGHSGGPLIDAHGRLVGINTMMNGPEVGLAVPVHEAKSFLRNALGS